MNNNPNLAVNPEADPSLVNERNEELARTLRYAHERFGISLDVTDAVNRTIELSGFKAIDPPLTPSVTEWIYERITTQGYAGYNHGSFVESSSGELGFAKVHYGPDSTIITLDENGKPKETIIGGPQREAQVLEALGSNGYEAPKVIGYNPETPQGASSAEADTYEILVIEAVLPEYGAVRSREEWTPQLARIAAQKIATFAKPIEEIPLFADEHIPLPIEKLVEQLPFADEEYGRAVLGVLEDYPHLDSPIVVHGDTWFNNIIARHDDTDLMFVDWELAGPGYKGQDAGRKLWDLTINDSWDVAEYTEVAATFTSEWCKDEDDRTSLKFGVTYESLRWVTDRVNKVNDPTTDEATRISLLQEIEDIKAHTLDVLENIKHA